MVGRPLGRGPKPQKRKTVAPDDDPNFLRDLDKKLRKEDDDNKDESN
ncbi:MAG: hypothetical protein RL450_618 [Actinomycetota bacterium]